MDIQSIRLSPAPAYPMNAPLFPEVLLRRDQSEPELALAAEGVQRWVWESKFGAMLIEVRDGRSYVNGEPVESAESATDGK